MYDGMKFDVSTQKQGQLLGAGSYCLMYYFAEQLMKVGIDFVLESNFVDQARQTLTSLTERYDYESLVILFDAPVEILHQRFIDREMNGQRHTGLGKCVYDDFEKFRKVSEKPRTFSFGKRKMVVDTSNFSKVNYDDIDGQIIALLRNNCSVY